LTNLLKSVEEKKPGDIDTELMLKMKTWIRQAEARAACRYSGIADEHIHFLNMPFYETGRAKKNHPGEKDQKLIEDLIKKVKPHQIYAAGDLSDPHGTHRICWDVIRRAVSSLETEEWMGQCYIWLYKGVWQDWDISEIDMAVPLSPGERMKKRRAIFKHASQKDQPKYPGAESREFWMIADERTIKTAELYDRLGLAEYDSIEGFTRYHLNGKRKDEEES
jgi:glucosamine-6-phosphate deaminase